MRFLALAALAAAISSAAVAQAPIPFTDPANLRGERVRPHDGRELPIDLSEAQGGRGLEQLLRKLNTRASLMLIVAHPDDEDGGMLTFYSRGLGARVADLSLNRGEGGQNLMTGDFEDALGLLRTQELLSADRYFAADQLFGTEVDFGFSKTKEEAFAKWTHDRVLYDAVRAVRIYRPLVIASVFIGGVTDGHGQHQVAGQIAQEVFKAAGDPSVFPELTAEGILPWQPLKVYARVPRQAITPEGLFDYATGQYIPAKFTNYVTGEVTTTAPSADVVIHEGKVDPILGPHRAIEDFLSYVQFARQGLGLQKSQIGAGVRVPPPGAFDVAYHLYGSRVPSRTSRDPITHDPQTASFFDGIDTTLAGIANLAPPAFPVLHEALAKIQADINVATDHLDPNNPGKIAPTLADALAQCDALIASIESSKLAAEPKANVLHELRIKCVQLNDAIGLALGLSLHVALKDHAGSLLTPGEALHAQIDFTNGTDTTLPFTASLRNDSFTQAVHPLGSQPRPAAPHATTSFEISLGNSPAEAVTRPYFTRPNIQQPTYDLLLPDLRNAPATPPPFTVALTVSYRGVSIKLVAPVMGTDRLPHLSKLEQPVSIVPPVSLILSPHTQVLANGEQSFLVNLQDDYYGNPKPRNIPCNDSSASHRIAPEKRNQTPEPALPACTFPAIPIDIDVPADWTSSPAMTGGSFPEGPTPFLRIQIPKVPENARHPATLKAVATLPEDSGYKLSIPATAQAGSTYSEGFRPIGYGDLPRTNYYTPATIRVVPVDLNLPTKRRIAYLPGTGDAVPDALASIGLTPTLITVADLNVATLAKYDTVVLGVRTYAAHPELHGAPTQALLDFARNGGNVVVQYQTGEFTAADAPYTLALPPSVSQGTVVDETAPVLLLDASAALLSKPNQISPADFNGWIAERGHGFLREWDPHYTALTETHDPGGAETAPQAPQRGGLITTALGKGHWTYCAFALYRQLPEAVPGAFRLFVNLLSP